MYLQRRDGLQLERNRLIATFLRTLKYYPGIFFLTTNMLQDFDEAILDQIQLKLQYQGLDSSARQTIFRHFFTKARADIVEDKIRTFAGVGLNGQQVEIRSTAQLSMNTNTLKIKNVVKLAHNVAMSDGVQLRVNHA